MVITDGGHHITAIEYNIKPDAVAIGMGISQEQQTQEAFYDFISGNTMPLVLDADAVNILSYNKDWLKKTPSLARTLFLRGPMVCHLPPLAILQAWDAGRLNT